MSAMDDVKMWLREEVLDLLDAGPVGLYEFIWLLNGRQLGLDERELRELAAEVLRGLVQDDPSASVCILIWPDFTLDHEVDLADPPAQLTQDSYWDRPGPDGKYPALCRTC